MGMKLLELETGLSSLLPGLRMHGALPSHFLMHLHGMALEYREDITLYLCHLQNFVLHVILHLLLGPFSK